MEHSDHGEEVEKARSEFRRAIRGGEARRAYLIAVEIASRIRRQASGPGAPGRAASAAEALDYLLPNGHSPGPGKDASAARAGSGGSISPEGDPSPSCHNGQGTRGK